MKEVKTITQTLNALKGAVAGFYVIEKVHGSKTDYRAAAYALTECIIHAIEDIEQITGVATMKRKDDK